MPELVVVLVVLFGALIPLAVTAWGLRWAYRYLRDAQWASWHSDYLDRQWESSYGYLDEEQRRSEEGL